MKLGKQAKIITCRKIIVPLCILGALGASMTSGVVNNKLYAQTMQEEQGNNLLQEDRNENIKNTNTEGALTLVEGDKAEVQPIEEVKESTQPVEGNNEKTAIDTNEEVTRESKNVNEKNGMIQEKAVGDIAIDATNFPDENFRKYILAQSYGTDGVLTQTEVLGVTYMDVSSQKISELKGIEYFTVITTLSCEFNNLSTLDLSKNTALEYLVCMSNNLSTINVSENTNLISLRGSYNNLNELDISKNTALEALDCSHNSLSELDVSKNIVLESIYCSYNSLSKLDVSKNAVLKSITSDDNQLSTLDVSKNIALLYLSCSNNQLRTLNVSKNTALESLYIDRNYLISITTSSLSKLTDINSNSQNSITISLKDGKTEFDLSSIDPTIEESNIENLTGASLSGTVLQSLVPGTDVEYTSHCTIINNMHDKDMKVIIHVVGVNQWETPLSISNWIYGEEASSPIATSLYGVPTYTYSDSLTGTFTSEVPSEVGKWYVKAIVTGTTAYDGLESNVVQFEIKQKKYNVTFEDFDGSIIKQDTLDFRTTITAPVNPTREGYTFTGWTPSLDATVPASDVTYKATYTINTYSVTFEDFNGNVLKEDKMDFGAVITAPVNPTREGYTFTGWTPALDATVPGSDVIYKAIYHKNPELKKVRFIAYAGEDFDDFIQTIADESIIVKLADSSILPAGITMLENGEIKGFPTKVGIYEVEIELDDAQGVRSNMMITIEVKEAREPIAPLEPTKPTEPTEPVNPVEEKMIPNTENSSNMTMNQVVNSDLKNNVNTGIEDDTNYYLLLATSIMLLCVLGIKRKLESK